MMTFGGMTLPMTDTYTFLDKGTISNPSSIHENHYVTYTTPSPEDKDWSLTFTEASSPTGADHKPLYYYAVWRFIDDTHAQQDYPIFRALAMSRNWAPVESRPITPTPDPECRHRRGRITSVGPVGDRIKFWYKCLECGKTLSFTERL